VFDATGDATFMKRKSSWRGTCPSGGVLLTGLTKVLNALLARNGLLRTFPGTCVGSGPLSTHRQILAVAKASERTDILEPLNVLLKNTAELAFDHVIVVEKGSNPSQLIVAQFTSALSGIDVGSFTNFTSQSGTNAK
jgi:hypothetical protein